MNFKIHFTIIEVTNSCQSRPVDEMSGTYIFKKGKQRASLFAVRMGHLSGGLFYLSVKVNAKAEVQDVIFNKPFKKDVYGLYRVKHINRQCTTGFK